MNNDQIFARLCNSAIEFLNSAIADLEEKPKFALLHFCSAVELILKARLLREHWSLVVTKSPDQRAFLSGNFISVSPPEAMLRLEKICNDGISVDAKKAFQTTINHRNSVMHFYHTHEGENIEEFRKQVASDVCIGVYHLELCLRKWREYFLPHIAEFRKTFELAKAIRSYLDISYKSLSPELEKLVKAGVVIEQCKSCGFKSAPLEDLSANLKNQVCRVCKVSENRVLINCNNCGTPHKLSEYDGFQIINCPCGVTIDQDELEDLIRTDVPEDFEAPINCALCSNPGNVILHGTYLVCLECLGHDTEAYYCEWCSEGQIGGGDLGNSYLAGCEFCDGKGEWHRDD